MAAGCTGAKGVVALVGGRGIACHIGRKENGCAGGVNFLPVHRHRDLQVQAFIVVVYRLCAVAKALIFFVGHLFPVYLQGLQGIGTRIQAKRI
jgi:hypothetical protein